MIKKGIAQPLLLVILIIVVASIGAGSGLFAIGFDGFETEDSFSRPQTALNNQDCEVTKLFKPTFGSPKPQEEVCIKEPWQVNLFHSPTQSSQCRDERSSTRINNGKLEIISKTGTQSEVIYLNDLSGKDIRTNIEMFSKEGSFRIFLNKEQAYSTTLNANRQSDEILFEAIRDKQRGDFYHILIDGVKTKEIKIQEQNILIKYFVKTEGGNNCGQSSGTTITSRMEVDFLKSKEAPLETAQEQEPKQLSFFEKVINFFRNLFGIN